MSSGTKNKAPSPVPRPPCPLKILKRPSINELYDSIVTVKFTDDSQNFLIHKGLICHFSQFFRGAFASGFSEAQSQSVTLPLDDKTGFKTFFTWLYTGELFEGGDPINLQIPSAVVSIARGYIFAEAMGIPEMKNAIVDFFIIERCRQKWLPTEALTVIWSGTPHKDKMRKLFIDFITKNTIRDDLFADSNEAGFPHELQWELLKVFSQQLKLSSQQLPTYRGASDWADCLCDYHDHTDINAQPTVSETVDEGRGK